MDEIKIIKTKTDYNAALELLGKLMDSDPKRGTPEAEKLEFLVLLIKDYESKLFPDSVPDPVEAIFFRMEQQNLTQRDLIPFIGGRSRVSEVLSRTRPLTLSMIRALHKGLGIPLKSLVGEQEIKSVNEKNIDWEQFPIKEMIKRGWIETNAAKNNIVKVLNKFFEPMGTVQEAWAMYRMTSNIRSGRELDTYSLFAWNARVMARAAQNPCKGKYTNGTVTKKFMNEVIKLSVHGDGPLKAVEFLSQQGISLVIEPHLPKTYIDGAVIKGPKGPIIALTIRHDRIDNFWFSLEHELSHIARHYNKDISCFYDDLEVEDGSILEKEADELAGEVMIPSASWSVSPASRLRTPEAAIHLANKLNIHPAIVAGRMRKHFNSYHILNQLVGHGLVRKHFPEVSWGDKNV